MMVHSSYLDGWPSEGGWTLSVCNQPPRSTQVAYACKRITKCPLYVRRQIVSRRALHWTNVYSSRAHSAYTQFVHTLYTLHSRRCYVRRTYDCGEGTSYVRTRTISLLCVTVVVVHSVTLSNVVTTRQWWQRMTISYRQWLALSDINKHTNVRRVREREGSRQTDR